MRLPSIEVRFAMVGWGLVSATPPMVHAVIIIALAFTHPKS